MKSKICSLLAGVCSLFLSINVNADNMGKIFINNQNVDFCDKTTNPVECKANAVFQYFDWLVQYQIQHEKDKSLQYQTSIKTNYKTSIKITDNEKDIDYDKCIINTHDHAECKTLDLLNLLNQMIKNEIQENSKYILKRKTNILLKQYDFLMQYTHRTGIVKVYQQKKTTPSLILPCF